MSCKILGLNQFYNYFLKLLGLCQISLIFKILPLSLANYVSSIDNKVLIL